VKEGAAAFAAAPALTSASAGRVPLPSAHVETSHDVLIVGAVVSLMRGGHRSWEPATVLVDDRVG